MTPEQQASYIQHLEVKVADLEAEIARLKKEKGISGPREGLTFDKRAGVWSDKSGDLYCPTCLADDKRQPLKVETHGWRCTARPHYFSNPDAPHPVARRTGSPWGA